MAELKPYVEGQQIEPIKPRVYTTIEEQKELEAYREFGDLSQLRALCDNYHELLDELRSRPSEAEIRAKAKREIAEQIEKRIKEEVTLLESEREEAREYDDEQIIFATNNQLRAFDYSLRVIAEQLKGE